MSAPVKRERHFNLSGGWELGVVESFTVSEYGRYYDIELTLWFQGNDYKASANCRKYVFATVRRKAGLRAHQTCAAGGLALKCPHWPRLLKLEQ